MSRKTSIGLAALVLALAASLGLSSVAWSSNRATAGPNSSAGPSHQQLQQILKREAGHFHAAICQGPYGRQLRCAGSKSRGGKLAPGPRKLQRGSHFDENDPACPAYVIGTPRAVFATVATDAVAVCVTDIYGYNLLTGDPFHASQLPEIAALNLYAYTNHHWVNEAHTSSDGFGNCSYFAVYRQEVIYQIQAAKVCGIRLGVHAHIFPPAGTYRGKLTVVTPAPFWTGPTMVDDTSYDLCYFC